jgi:hypothetical protein
MVIFIVEDKLDHPLNIQDKFHALELQPICSSLNVKMSLNLRFELGLSDISMSTSSQDLPTSVIHIPRVDFRRNFENRPSQDLKDPFHKRVEIKLRALSDRMSAEKSAASSRSASYQPPDRAASTCRSSYQNADKLANSSRPSLLQNTGRVLAPSTNHRSSKGVRADTLPRESFFRKGSSVSHVASSNSTATEKSAAKIHVVPRSSQVGAKTYRSVQVI